MNLYQFSKFLFLVAFIGHGETAPAKAEFRGPKPYVGSRLDPYRTTLPINRTLLAGSLRKFEISTGTRDSISPRPQESLKKRVEVSVAGNPTIRSGADADEVNEDKPRIHSRSLQGRSKLGAFPWAGLNPQGTYPWTRTTICMAICERNTYHMRNALKGKGRWQACILKCKSDGSMTDITGEIYKLSFEEDFAPLSYYKGYLDHISDKAGVVEPTNWFLDWRPAY
ncbi:hypothetical protein BDP55DRAFT_639272 [Colletotrichum godetiae]|uniref:Uncharacterized protein n=1 Tax=Colletotrichum godetiae TaxID=1209918 RepID=A0AAJ0A5H1_9PEZI|nr:uncharacterized protein BDP55DRAFT_639272 [Colletotrichum godetiae]KAK1656848.1 hypothetical protein BDP55DRAFT_639272 [Colletotrichum godetiae]